MMVVKDSNRADSPKAVEGQEERWQDVSGTEDPNATILVVDDVEDTRTILRAFLEQRHYRVVEAINGQQAIEVALQEHPKLILMDLFMPLQDGISATRAIRKESELREVPIVALSAYGTLGILHHDALAAGCNEYVSKPLDFEQLGYLVDRLLKGAEDEQESRKEVTNEEVHRTMQFILEQQAQFAANNQLLQEAQARTEATVNALAQRVDTMAENHESRIAHLEESFQLLARLAERMDKTG